MSRSLRLRTFVAGGVAASMMLFAACSSDDDGSAADEQPAEGADEDGDDEEAPEEDLPELPELTEITVGYVSGVDQMGAAVALDLGFYDEVNLDVTLAQPFPTGVDALNALDAGEVDVVQVGVPSFGAVLEGMDLAYIGNYSGSSTQLGIDETMAIAASAESGIDPDDLSTLAGKRIGVSEGTINHLYLLAVLEDAGLTTDDVEIINTAPPDMPVALETDGVDAISSWDPWPIVIEDQVEGAFEAVRGGGYIAYIGYLTSTQEYVDQNGEAIEALLTARAAADKWMRENPEEAADVVVRWIPGTEIEVAEQAMVHNVIQLDPRFSACNYLALDTSLQQFADQDAISGTFDPNERIVSGPLVNVMERHPELFDDLPEIPDAAQIGSDYVFERSEAQAACPD